jgi:hypothetical protein
MSEVQCGRLLGVVQPRFGYAVYCLVMLIHRGNVPSLSFANYTTQYVEAGKMPNEMKSDQLS